MMISITQPHLNHHLVSELIYSEAHYFLVIRGRTLTIGDGMGCQNSHKQGGTELTEITTTVEIADATGHTTLQLTQRETLDRVAGMEGAWVFAGDRMVQPTELAEANWETVGTVRVVPGLVGGI